jgi:hypothetical protein
MVLSDVRVRHSIEYYRQGKAAFGPKKHLCFFVLLMAFDGITAARVQVVTSELGAEDVVAFTVAGIMAIVAAR